MRFGPHRAVCTVDAARGCLEVRLSIEQSWCWPWSWQRDEEEAGSWNAVSSFRLFPPPRASPLIRHPTTVRLFHFRCILPIPSPFLSFPSLSPPFSTSFPLRRDPLSRSIGIALTLSRLLTSSSFLPPSRPSLPTSRSPCCVAVSLVLVPIFSVGGIYVHVIVSGSLLSPSSKARSPLLVLGILILFTNASFTFTQLRSEERGGIVAG